MTHSLLFSYSQNGHYHLTMILILNILWIQLSSRHNILSYSFTSVIWLRIVIVYENGTGHLFFFVNNPNKIYNSFISSKMAFRAVVHLLVWGRRQPPKCLHSQGYHSVALPEEWQLLVTNEIIIFIHPILSSQISHWIDMVGRHTSFFCGLSFLPCNNAATNLRSPTLLFLGNPTWRK